MSNNKYSSIILIARSDAQMRAQGASVTAANESEATKMSSALQRVGATISTLFGETEERLIERVAALPQAEPIELHLFYEVQVSDLSDADVELLRQTLAAISFVDSAYLAPLPVPASIIDETINSMQPASSKAPSATPNFVARQGYLDASPGGINATYAWTKPGGRGAGVNIIDCEGAWRFSHEDLRANNGGVIGPETEDLVWRNHGTAVAGEIGGDINKYGVTGICPDAVVRGSSIFGPGRLPAAIRAAADRLKPGDIILIEVQYTHYSLGYTAVEWWPADHAAIRYAVARGVIVVEAAGNGNNDLDNTVYNERPKNFPPNWSNPFRRGAADSGAIIVGAGAPPPGTHGRDHGPDRSRLGFSNYGTIVDAQGWGREVTTTGYGDLQGGSNEDLWYTDQFSGTSSASPIIVGVLGCLQGILRSHGSQMLTPQKARQILRSSGAEQTDAPGRPKSQRIGNRPDLRYLIDRLPLHQVTTVPLYRYYNGQNTDHFYTTNRSEVDSNSEWAYEGIQCYILPKPIPGSVPLHRYWHALAFDHFYTTDPNEIIRRPEGWSYEGIQGYVMPQQVTGTVPLYRYWGHTDHFYTTSRQEIERTPEGWNYEGIQCYVYTRVVSLPVSYLQNESLTGGLHSTLIGVDNGEPLMFSEKTSDLLTDPDEALLLDTQRHTTGSVNVDSTQGESYVKVKSSQKQGQGITITITIKVDNEH
jgi:hypothetical protein